MVGCCGKGAADDDNESNAINKDRKCRDVLFLILFIVFWVGMLYVGYTAFDQGNPNMLFYGLDSHGNLCGDAMTYNHSAYDFKTKKQQYFFNPMVAADAETMASMSLAAIPSICVDGCPSDVCSLADLSAAIANPSKPSKCLDNNHFYCEYYKWSGLKQSDLKDESTVIDEWDTNYFTKLSITAQLSSLTPGKGPCFPVFLETTNFLNRCIPTIPPAMIEWLENNVAASSASGAAAGANSTDGSTDGSTAGSTDGDAEAGSGGNLGLDAATLKLVAENLMGSRDYLQDYVTDTYKAWAAILVSGVMGSVVLSMVWMTIVRYCAGCMAWTTVFLVNVLSIVLALFCALKSGLIESEAELGADFMKQYGGKTYGLENPAEKDREYFEYATYVTAVIAGIILLLTLVLAKRIAVAVGCLKVASQAISSMPMLLFFPLITFAMTLALIVYWLIVSAFLYSCGKIEQSTDGSYEIVWNDTLRYMMLYHLFGLLWTQQFIVGFGLMVIAGAISQFYWSKGDSKNMPMAPIMNSVCRTLYYHLGSIALGAFIVAVIQFIRVILEYIDRKTKELQEGNPVYKYLMYCVKYCMWYLEKIMKFINRNAYIIVATKGTSYCSSALRAVYLLVSNALRLMAVNTVGDLLTWLGKVVVASSCGVIAFLMTDLPMYTDKSSDTYLSSPFVPVLFSIIIGYFIANLFFQVYEMAVDTVLLSFCEDCEQNNGNPKYAPKLLMDAIGKAPTDNKVKPKKSEGGGGGDEK